jgi:hypothetical protein
LQPVRELEDARAQFLVQRLVEQSLFGGDGALIRNRDAAPP